MMRAPANPARRLHERPRQMKLIGIVTNCLNEEGNVELVFERNGAVVLALRQYRYDRIIVDNWSNSHRVEGVKAVGARVKHMRLTADTRNRLSWRESIEP